MTDYRFTPEAEDDLFEIWCYIARDNVAAANRVESAVHDACAFLAQDPQSGSQRKHVTLFRSTSGQSSSIQTMLSFTARKLNRWKLFAFCMACAISSGCSIPESSVIGSQSRADAQKCNIPSGRRIFRAGRAHA
jgi:plasmid stabilization system protein ParE